MSVSGTNQSKNTVTPQGSRKAGIYTWGDSIATWGDTLATWGNTAIAAVNQLRSPTGATTLTIGSPMGLLLSITYPTTTTSGSGAVNQAKS